MHQNAGRFSHLEKDGNLANLAESLSQQCLADHPQEKDDAADWPRFRWHQLASHVYLSTELEIQSLVPCYLFCIFSMSQMQKYLYLYLFIK